MVQDAINLERKVKYIHTLEFGKIGYTAFNCKKGLIDIWVETLATIVHSKNYRIDVIYCDNYDCVVIRKGNICNN